MGKGSFQTSKGSYGVDVEWSSVADNATNTSIVTVNVYVRYYSINIGSRTCRCTINGEYQEITVDGISHNGSAQRKLVGTFEQEVTHDADGTKTCAISGGFYFNLTSGSYGYIEWLDAGGTITLDSIPRAAILTATGGVIGGEATFSWMPNSDDHTFSLSVQIGNKGITPTVTGNTAKVTLSPETLLSEMTGAPPTASGKAILTTYQKEAVVGTSEASFQVTMPPYTKPVVTLANCYRADSGGDPAADGTYLYLEATVTSSDYEKDSTYQNEVSLYMVVDDLQEMELLRGNGDYNGIVTGLELLTTNAYKIKLFARDKTEESVPITVYIPTAAADFHLRHGGKGAAFGCYATIENAVQIAEGWALYIGNQTLEEYIKSLL